MQAAGRAAPASHPSVLERAQRTRYGFQLQLQHQRLLLLSPCFCAPPLVVSLPLPCTALPLPLHVYTLLHHPLSCIQFTILSYCVPLLWRM